MARYVDIEPIMNNIQQLRGCTCSCSDGIIDDVEMMMDMAPDADVIPIPEGVTNGDIIKAIFPTETFELSSGVIEDQFGRIRVIYDKWTAPYKAKS